MIVYFIIICSCILVGYIVFLVFKSMQKKNRRHKRNNSDYNRKIEKKTQEDDFVSVPKTHQQQNNKIEQLYNIMCKAEKIKRYRIYSTIFNQASLPIQLLFGVNKEYGGESYEVFKEQLDKKFINAFSSAITSNSVTFDSGGFHVAVDEYEQVEYETFVKQIAISMEEIDGYIEKYDIEYNDSLFYLTMKEVIENIGKPLYIIVNNVKNSTGNSELVRKSVGEIKDAMQKQGIAPLFYSEISEQPLLQEKFVIGKDVALEYPGIFIKKKNQYQQLGNCVGRRKQGVE